MRKLSNQGDGITSSKAMLIRMLVIFGIVSLLFLAGCGGSGGNTNHSLTNQPPPHNPAPTITTMSPNSAVAGGAPFTLTVNGTNFIAASMVNFGGTALTITVVSSTRLTVAIPAAAIASAGTAAVTVTNPAPGGGTSNAVSFTIASGPNPIPTMSDLRPSGAPVGGPDFTLWIRGDNFVASSVVRWEGSDRPTTVVNSHQIIAQIPANDISATGTAAVTVFNPVPGGGSSNTRTFTIATGGVCPSSIAVDPTGKFAYVVNSGCSDFIPTMSIYTVNATTGDLTSIGRVPADFCPHSVTVDPFGKFAYVANYGGGYCGYTPGNVFTDGSVSMYNIDPTAGALTSIASPVEAGTCANSVAVDPFGKFVYVAYSTCGDDLGGVPMYEINATTGALTSIGVAGAGMAPISVAVHPSGKFAYVANGSVGYTCPWCDPNDSVSMFTINATTGALGHIGAVAAGSSPRSIAIDPSGKFAYAGVSIYTINTTTGTLIPIGTIAGGQSLDAIHPSGKFAYGMNGPNTVSMYSVDPNTGDLALIGTIGTGSGPTSIAIHPSGKFAYVTNGSSNDVSMYSIDPATGALTLIGTIGT